MSRFFPWILAAAAAMSCAHAGTAARVPSVDLSPAKAPFGASVGTVLDPYSRYGVTEDGTPYIEAIGGYVLEEFFKGGLQKQDKGTCFYPSVVKKYRVVGPPSGGVGELTFYFEGFESPRQPYRLFIVKQRYRKPAEGEGDFRQVFKVRSRAITGNLKVEPAVHQGTYQDFRTGVHDYFYAPALVGVWDTGRILVFLMVADSTDGPVEPEIMFVFREGLERYLKNCKFMSDSR
ncbi:MAG: hypothetical protein JSV26_00560 [bacterium]|nr:MAG: hypothetical protein JSV26_00560 [bacterium]